MRQRTVPAGVFKNSCLKLIDEVHRDGIPVTVTKRGKPLVRIVPVSTAPIRKLLGTLVHQDPDIFSTGEIFEADT